MFQDAFIKLEKPEAEAVLKDINPALDGASFEAEGAVILAQDLPFYPGYRFFDIADHESLPPARRFVIYKPGDVIVLNWTNEPLYMLNDRVPILLDEQTVGPYVRFFFTHVRGRHGRFQIVESVDDIPWKEEPPPAARKAIGKLVEPVQVTETEDDGTFHLIVRMVFKDSLFKAGVSVKPNGLVSLADEELVIEDMPVLDDTFGM